MHISGLQKMTLLDYPGQVACTVFLPGCNFRCPFCHNSGLLTDTTENRISCEELLAFLQKRRGLLDAVCFTGGEPTLQHGLEALMRDIKALGFLIKLDTNGSRPAVLKQLVAAGVVDYVAMDIKNGPSHYAATCGIPTPDIAAVEESLSFLLSRPVDYELRTTVVDELHNAASFDEIGSWLHRLSPSQKATRFFLQSYTDRDSVLQSGLHAPSKEAMTAYRAQLQPFVEAVALRGVD